jgi:SAM-dependent methyltransferase
VNYRDLLYSDYSTHFSREERPDDALAFAIFDGIYPSMPPGPLPVLDLASGKGSWLRWMKSKGFTNLSGVDLSVYDLEQTGIPEATLHREDLFGFLNRTENTYSLIHAKDVIEHMTKNEVVEFLTACLKRLVPGGQLWISTFNALAPMASQTWFADFTHETSFAPDSMRQVMHACGFPEVEVRCVHPVPPTLKGKIRRVLLAPISAAAAAIAKLRYGGKGDFSCAPTLLAMATKAKA